MENILSSVLSQKSAQQSDFEKVQWLVSIMKWVQRPRTKEEKNTKGETVYTVRLKYLLNMLNNNPDWKVNFVDSISALLLQISSPTQYSKMGFSHQGFIQEFIHRLQEKILPKSPLTEDLETLIAEIFPHEDESLYVDFIEPSVLDELLQLFQGKSDLHLKLKMDLLSASYIMAVQLLNNLLTIRNELNCKDQSFESFPEFKLLGVLQDHQIKSDITMDDQVFSWIESIESDMINLYAQMQTRGVRIELVYLFQVQKRKLKRLRILLGFLSSQVYLPLNFRSFVAHMILDTSHHKSFKSFASENLSLLTERIVQANSRIGEHYVTYTWPEFRKMFQSAAGGGAVTAITVFLKLNLAKLGLVGFIKGLVDSLNYSGSFLLIQVMGWTLATKQPSNTAPFIAAELAKSTTEARRSIVALLRTQFIAVVGNLSVVFPICFLISSALAYFDMPLMDHEHAVEILSSTNLAGPAVFYAIFTGGLLFIASLAAAWIANWMTLIQLSKRIRYNDSLRSFIGKERTLKFANFVDHNSNALAANIVLGFFLGMTPPVAKFLGLALDVRHVTLSTGAFASSLPILLNTGLDRLDFLNSVLGILAIGFLNISVSFMLAFLLASASSNVKFSSFMRLFASGLHLILVRPWLLLVPEKINEE